MGLRSFSSSRLWPSGRARPRSRARARAWARACPTAPASAATLAPAPAPAPAPVAPPEAMGCTRCASLAEPPVVSGRVQCTPCWGLLLCGVRGHSCVWCCVHSACSRHTRGGCGGGSKLLPFSTAPAAGVPGAAVGWIRVATVAEPAAVSASQGALSIPLKRLIHCRWDTVTVMECQ